MHGSDDTLLSMSLMNLAFARGGINSKNDDRFVLERIAMMLWGCPERPGGSASARTVREGLVDRPGSIRYVEAT
jgi:hypothetical protein